MSWKTSGKLLGGPPTSSNTNKLDPRFRPNLGGLSAFQREQQLSSRYGGYDNPKPVVRTEWDVLKENHRFIRDDEEPADVSWEERMARAYESKLFKEFALIDLKHYKSKRMALRWRTAPEVVDGIGEDTCGSLRCKYHNPAGTDSRVQWGGDTPGPSISERGASPRGKSKRRRMPVLSAFELPFVYEEAGVRKEALVKVKLCPRCQAKLVWKPGRDDAESEEEAPGVEHGRGTARRRSRSSTPDGEDGSHRGGKHASSWRADEEDSQDRPRQFVDRARRHRSDDRGRRDDGDRTGEGSEDERQDRDGTHASNRRQERKPHRTSNISRGTHHADLSVSDIEGPQSTSERRRLRHRGPDDRSRSRSPRRSRV